MEIFIDDIKEDGLHIEAAVPGNAWLHALLMETVADQFTKDDTAKLEITGHKVNLNIDLSGLLVYTSHVPCDRCLKELLVKDTVRVHTHLAPLYESQKERARKAYEEERELVLEDLEFSFYEGDRIDLDDIIREHIVLSLPMMRLCQEDCKGLCQYCGKNLNEGSCQCAEKRIDPKWDALKKLKI
ncbi:MAG: hypothetical protein A3I05_05540 [Deltaproteobacteria bacterium RIFCSPLOWO2_02_FULL_44_10]|nr:MAG: hypothetical protein A3C46_06290 [Deltaproteobacteria bacterium RIFCSPHIGHO2_02_FULL_44_16]OGQ46047.1 MAG: hypothetical protein A3I05_05540 [Deltaproteobacteria bacterium RIFCSPLOWO2_02_FULL_44_10]